MAFQNMTSTKPAPKPMVEKLFSKLDARRLTAIAKAEGMYKHHKVPDDHVFSWEEMAQQLSQYAFDLGFDVESWTDLMARFVDMDSKNVSAVDARKALEDAMMETAGVKVDHCWRPMSNVVPPPTPHANDTGLTMADLQVALQGIQESIFSRMSEFRVGENMEETYVAREDLLSPEDWSDNMGPVPRELLRSSLKEEFAMRDARDREERDFLLELMGALKKAECNDDWRISVPDICQKLLDRLEVLRAGDKGGLKAKKEVMEMVACQELPTRVQKYRALLQAQDSEDRSLEEDLMLWAGQLYAGVATGKIMPRTIANYIEHVRTALRLTTGRSVNDPMFPAFLKSLRKDPANRPFHRAYPVKIEEVETMVRALLDEGNFEAAAFAALTWTTAARLSD
eukprot:gene18407-835_t